MERNQRNDKDTVHHITSDTMVKPVELYYAHVYVCLPLDEPSESVIHGKEIILEISRIQIMDNL